MSEAVGTSTPASVADIEEGAALAAAAADAPAAQAPGRAASITLGQLARESSDQLPPVAMAGRAHSVPAQQAPLPPSLPQAGAATDQQRVVLWHILSP